MIDEFDDLTKPADSKLTPEQRLVECYIVLRRVAYGSGKPGNKPLAGGVEKFAKLFLERHGISNELNPVPLTCPHCGRPMPCESVEDVVP